MPPAAPQKPTPGTLQTPLEQQPVGHVDALHAIAAHAPAMQRNPAPHAAAVPQVHAPLDEQALATFGSQAPQADPALPHTVTDRVVVQVEPAQQPKGQFAALHVFATQDPDVHRWFAPQEGPLPHLQDPAAQLSAALESHA